MPKGTILKRRVKHSKQAKRDIIDIWFFVAQDNRTAANKTLKEIEKRVKMLAHTPYMGRRRHDLHRTLYSFPVERNVIFYQPGKEEVIIVRILHAARDSRNLL